MVGNGGVRGSTGVMGDVVKRCRYVWQARYEVRSEEVRRNEVAQGSWKKAKPKKRVGDKSMQL